VDWFEKMLDQRDAVSVFMPRLPYAKALRESPRWPELAKRMNLPAEAR